MLQVVGDPRRIDKAIRRLQGALKGVPARSVRLTWRGGELRTTIHWARDDSFWWAFEPRAPRATPCCWATRPMRRPSARASPARSTCRAKAPTGRSPASSPPTRRARCSSPIPAAWAAPGPASASRRFREFLADGVWRPVIWPDGEETDALIVAPLDSPRLTRLLGGFVDAVRSFKAGDAPMHRTGLCVEPSARDSAAAACDRRLVDVALHEELSKRGLFGGADDLFSLRGERPQPLFALVADGRPEELAMAVGSLSLASARGGPDVRPILIAPADAGRARRRCSRFAPLHLRALPLARRPRGLRRPRRRTRMISPW